MTGITIRRKCVGCRWGYYSPVTDAVECAHLDGKCVRDKEAKEVKESKPAKDGRRRIHEN